MCQLFRSGLEDDKILNARGINDFVTLLFVYFKVKRKKYMYYINNIKESIGKDALCLIKSQSLESG